MRATVEADLELEAGQGSHERSCVAAFASEISFKREVPSFSGDGLTKNVVPGWVLLLLDLIFGNGNNIISL